MRVFGLVFRQRSRCLRSQFVEKLGLSSALCRAEGRVGGGREAEEERVQPLCGRSHHAGDSR